MQYLEKGSSFDKAVNWNLCNKICGIWNFIKIYLSSLFLQDFQVFLICKCFLRQAFNGTHTSFYCVNKIIAVHYFKRLTRTVSLSDSWLAHLRHLNSPCGLWWNYFQNLSATFYRSIGLNALFKLLVTKSLLILISCSFHVFL